MLRYLLLIACASTMTVMFIDLTIDFVFLGRRPKAAMARLRFLATRLIRPRRSVHLDVTFPDGTSHRIHDPLDAELALVIAVKTPTGWVITAGFRPGEEAAAHEAAASITARHLEAVVLPATRGKSRVHS